MNRPNQGHYKSHLLVASNAPNEPEEQQRRCHMQKNIRQVVPSRIRTEHFNVRHMTQPSERMPVSYIHTPKGPSAPLERQTILDVIVVCDISRIIKSMKRMIDQATVNRQNRAYNKQIVYYETATGTQDRLCHSQQFFSSVSDFVLRAARGKWRSPFAPETIIFLGSVETFFAGSAEAVCPPALWTWTARRRCFCRMICASGLDPERSRRGTGRSYRALYP